MITHEYSDFPCPCLHIMKGKVIYDLFTKNRIRTKRQVPMFALSPDQEIYDECAQYCFDNYDSLMQELDEHILKEQL